MKIKIGNYKVVSSGSIVSILNEPLDFIFEEYNNFIVRFNFIEDIKKINEHSAKVEAFGNNGLQFFFTNYNNVLGTGNAEPLRLASVNNNTEQFYMIYRIYSLQNSGKHVHYSFLTKSN